MVCSPVEQHGLRLVRAEPGNGVSAWPATPIAAAAHHIWVSLNAVSRFFARHEQRPAPTFDEQRMNRIFGLRSADAR
jgi:hypothetical protein